MGSLGSEFAGRSSMRTILPSLSCHEMRTRQLWRGLLTPLIFRFTSKRCHAPPCTSKLF
jgi:hypothetical protein